VALKGHSSKVNVQNSSDLPCVPRKPNTAAAIITLHMEAWSSVDGDWHRRSVTYYMYEVGSAGASCEGNDLLPWGCDKLQGTL